MRIDLHRHAISGAGAQHLFNIDVVPRTALQLPSGHVTNAGRIGVASGLVMDGLQAIDRRRDALIARLQLQGKKLRVVARLVQIATVKP
jgi:hypothetical protein